MARAANTQLITFIVCEIKITCGFELIVILSFVKSTQTTVVTLYDVENMYIKINYYSFSRWWPVVYIFIEIFCGSKKGKGSF